MEILKKTILQAVTTGTTFTGGTIIIPDLNAIYYVKVGLKQVARDIGFFDAFDDTVPEPPAPPTETFYLVDSEGNVFIDDDNIKFLY